jgi:hypothetical protein
MRTISGRIPIAFLFLAAALRLSALPVEASGVDAAMLPDRILESAFAVIGTPYEVGATGPTGFDCSGLIFRVFQDLTGQSLPRTVDALMAAGRKVEGGLLPADLVFFDTTGGPSHVGIYIGGGRFVHSASQGRITGVMVSALGENYYKMRYLGARRILEWTVPLVRIPVSEQPSVETVSDPLPSGITGSYQIVSKLPEDAFLTIRFYRGTGAIFDRTVKVPAGGAGGLGSLTTQPGEWAVVITTATGLELYRLSFSVAE